MPEKIVKVKVFSDGKDVSSVASIVKQVNIPEAKIYCQTPRKIEIGQNDIVVLLINKFNSNLLTYILDHKDALKNKFILVTRNDSALLVSSLVKLGLTNIFLFPHEIPKFTFYLEEIITNNSYSTVTDTNKESELWGFNTIIGTSSEFLSIIEIAKRVSENSYVSVLILGETGTGKSLLAKAIHKNSRAASAPFIEIVCSAIPENLLESELFGHEKGAFTNALYRKLGLFELAENGTLLLDEVGDLSLNLQVKLLRVIEKKIIRRLGGVEDISVNTRIISATNRDLNEMVENDLFRKDLFHRLNVVSILIPPLRERKDDVLPLAWKFIEEFNKQFNKSVNKIEKKLEEFMLTYTWPGNVRELRNAIERAVLLSEINELKLPDFSNLLKNLPLNLLEREEHIAFHPHLIRLDLSYEKTNLLKLSTLYAKEVVKKMGGNKSKTARILGISRPKLDKLLNDKN